MAASERADSSPATPRSPPAATYARSASAGTTQSNHSRRMFFRFLAGRSLTPIAGVLLLPLATAAQNTPATTGAEAYTETVPGTTVNFEMVPIPASAADEDVALTECIYRIITTEATEHVGTLGTLVAEIVVLGITTAYEVVAAGDS